MAGGKTRVNTLIGSALHSEVSADGCPGLLAQLVEQVTLNHRVGGSSPSQPTYAEWSLAVLQSSMSEWVGLN